MKIFRFVGVVILIIALLFALALVGRIQTEERYFRQGELLVSQMLTDAEILRWLGVSAVIAVIGGIVLALYFITDRPSVDDLFDDDPEEIVVPPFTCSVKSKEYINITADELIGEIEIWGYSYKLYGHEDIYVITSADSSVQYWRGNMTDLRRLEAELDEH